LFTRRDSLATEGNIIEGGGIYLLMIKPRHCKCSHSPSTSYWSVYRDNTFRESQ